MPLSSGLSAAIRGLFSATEAGVLVIYQTDSDHYRVLAPPEQDPTLTAAMVRQTARALGCGQQKAS